MRHQNRIGGSTMASGGRLLHIWSQCGVFVLAGLACLVFSSPVRADIMAVSIQQPISVTAGTGGGFDVFLTNVSGPDVVVGGFNFELDSVSADVTFLDATTAGATYIFQGNSFADAFLGGDIAISASPNLVAADSVNTPFTGTTIAAGTTVDLGHVLFTTSARSQTEGVGIGFGITNLSDPNGVDIPIATLTGATIDITAATVPEPSSALLLFGVMLAVIWMLRIRSSASR
jgi:hypothetical protein